MRRIALLLLALMLAAPAASLAGRAAPGDGSLVVSNADGVLTVKVTGVIYGHFDRGKMIVLEYKAENNALPTVSGAKMELKGAKINVVYTGNDVRFLFPTGTFKLRFDGSGIDLSAVGKGTLQVAGKSTPEDGTVALNGGRPTPLPSVASFGSSQVVTANVEKSFDRSGDRSTDKSSGSTTTSSSGTGR
jgi:hypothetical protein